MSVENSSPPSSAFCHPYSAATEIILYSLAFSTVGLWLHFTVQTLFISFWILSDLLAVYLYSAARWCYFPCPGIKSNVLAAYNWFYILFPRIKSNVLAVCLSFASPLCHIFFPREARVFFLRCTLAPRHIDVPRVTSNSLAMGLNSATYWCYLWVSITLQ
jgi:hypothetical protein